MRIIGAYLLAVLGGNENPKEEDIKAILQSVGIEVKIYIIYFLVKIINHFNHFFYLLFCKG